MRALRRCRRSVWARLQRRQRSIMASRRRVGWRLCGCRIERRAAEPGMIRDVEHHLVGSVELGLVETLLSLGPAREAFGAERLELFDHVVDVLDQHAEMMD